MEENNDFLAQQQLKEAQRYLHLSLQGIVILTVLALALNLVAALVSHIALWQVLVWLSSLSVIGAVLFAFTHWWIARNNF